VLELFPALILLAIIGLGAGALGAMLGVGGGIIMVPALTFLGISPSQTASTSLVAVTATGVSSTVEYTRQKRIEYRLGILMAALAVPGAVVGAFLSSTITLEQFRLYFGIFLMLVGIYVLYKNSILRERVEGPKRLNSYRLLGISSASFAAGIISSLFGVGGGTIFVPLLLLIVGVGMHRAAATSQLTLVITSAAGVATHAFLGHPDYIYAVALSAGAIVGAQIGARMSKSARDVLLQRILGVVLIGVGVKFVVDWLFSR
jgi:uncharacterized membrane protein YfcA